MVNTSLFHSHEVPSVFTFLGTESRVVAARAREEGMRSDYLIGLGFCFGKMEKAQEMDGCDGCITTHTVNATELYS